jgi:hypothetical protein
VHLSSIYWLNTFTWYNSDICVYNCRHVTRSQNESGLSKYLMVHEQLCSIRDLYLAMSTKVSDINQISRGNALLVGGKSSSSARAASDEKTLSISHEKKKIINWFFKTIILWKKVQIIKINGFIFLCVMHKFILSQNLESVKSSEGFIFLFIQIHFPVEQKGECIVRHCGRPCDEVAERVWPIKISDGARTTLFNKGLVSCDVNQG